MLTLAASSAYGISMKARERRRRTLPDSATRLRWVVLCPARFAFPLRLSLPARLGSARRCILAAPLAAWGESPRSEVRRVGEWSSDVCSSDLYVNSGSLIGLWHFDESTGTAAADSSGLGHAASLGCALPGTLCLSTPTFTPGPTGLGTALHFSGASGAMARVAQIGSAACRGMEFRRVLFRSLC